MQFAAPKTLAQSNFTVSWMLAGRFVQIEAGMYERGSRMFVRFTHCSEKSRLNSIRRESGLLCECRQIPSFHAHRENRLWPKIRSVHDA